MNREAQANSSPVRRDVPKYLPGVQGLWVFVIADMSVFGMLFVLFMVGRHGSPELFEASRHTLNPNIGGINTVILLTSSWAIARAVSAAAHDRLRELPYFIAGAFLCGVTFAVLKIVEYSVKLNDNISLVSNEFYMYYYTITGIHLVHVVVGSVILAVLWIKARGGEFKSTNLVTLEAGATFWHMVDLLWIMLFTLLYLVR